jgi:hypothetical protein
MRGRAKPRGAPSRQTIRLAHVLEGDPNWRERLREIALRLHPGGRFYFHERHRRCVDAVHAGAGGTRSSLFFPDELFQAMRAAGLEVVSAKRVATTFTRGVAIRRD